ncbi:hypothetical protein [Paenibacillus sp. Aloe-11]|uniref:hypothetical protein n=1 Tax=Paenibacillus sp. Aloe-11 TaxID=1050222 RepID=UPI00024EFF8E|nr:hypothetical protein [Paenibacillus sp. Aloe-11]EHS59425.1 hypothetical protein WG8_0640 [Paenibacillus sp. Aloe-11]
MTDQQLNRKLAQLMGYSVHTTPGDHFVLISSDNKYMSGVCDDEITAWKLVPDYCNDPATSLEVQAAAIELDRVAYVINLYEACYDFKRDKDTVWDEINIAFLLNASPRQRAEAAYITLSGQD